MPEGDTIHLVARRLRPLLAGRRLTDAAARLGTGRRYGPPRVALTSLDALVGGEVRDVYAVGKHLLVEVDGHVLRVHLGMSGSWHRYPHGAPWRRAERDVGLLLVTEEDVVVCFRPPSVTLESKKDAARQLAHLGPDLLGDVDWTALRDAVAARPDVPVADLLLDQRVASGIGNVYKNDLLFLHGVHPDATVAEVGLGNVMAMYRRAARLLRENVEHGGMRSTTGRHEEGERTWVHGRSGPCRKCGAELSFSRHGPQTRHLVVPLLPTPNPAPAPMSTEGEEG